MMMQMNVFTNQKILKNYLLLIPRFYKFYLLIKMFYQKLIKLVFIKFLKIIKNYQFIWNGMKTIQKESYY